MDLGLYLRIIRRFRLLVAAGLVLGLALGFLSFVRVGVNNGVKLAYREREQWVSYSTLFVTQEGFPWGRSVIQTNPAAAATAGPKKQAQQQLFADPSRFSGLAVLYSHLATSDQVRAIMLRAGGPLHGQIDAAPVLASQNAFADALPLIQIAAISNSGHGAVRLAERATDAFRLFLEQQQEVNAIPSSGRVIVTVLKRADEPKLLAGRSLTLPIVIVMAVLLTTFVAAFVLENVRPRPSEEASPELRPAAPLEASRRSASA